MYKCCVVNRINLRQTNRAHARVNAHARDICTDYLLGLSPQTPRIFFSIKPLRFDLKKNVKFLCEPGESGGKPPEPPGGLKCSNQDFARGGS